MSQAKAAGWTDRRTRAHDARLVRVLDFERALGLIAPQAPALLLLVYRDGFDRRSAADTAALSLAPSPTNSTRPPSPRRHPRPPRPAVIAFVLRIYDGFNAMTENPFYYYTLSRLELECDSFDLGHDVRLSRTYLHLMAHPTLAFSPPGSGKHHLAPWRPVNPKRGTASVDLLAQLAVPNDRTDDELAHRWASWIAVLLQVMTGANVTVTLVSSGNAQMIKNDESTALLVEQLPTSPDTRGVVTSEMVRWLNANWYDSFSLYENDDLTFAAASLYHSHRSSSELGLVSVWGALERLFSTNSAELKYRVCTNLAAYLEPPGELRYQLFKRLSKLYDDRSSAAHGSPMKNANAYRDSVAIASRAMLRIIENRQIPAKDSLERELLAPSRFS